MVQLMLLTRRHVLAVNLLLDELGTVVPPSASNSADTVDIADVGSSRFYSKSDSSSVVCIHGNNWHDVIQDQLGFFAAYCGPFFCSYCTSTS